jgi:DNA polymerase
MCLKARVMVVGQNPGETKVRLGRPFVGPSGEFFDRVIADVLGIGRDSLYICNTVRCYTQGNRAPSKAEVLNCQEFLDREIAIIKPTVVVTLGGPALERVMGLSGITKHHGEIIISPRHEVRVLPLYHPSPLNMNKPRMREEFVMDIRKLVGFLNG